MNFIIWNFLIFSFVDVNCPLDGVANENLYYPKIATCVLQSVNTNFTPNGVRSHADGSPVIITMDLQFLETEMITKDHIQEGF